MQSHVVDVTQENFQHIMFEESKQRLVLLDFWADWCAPCKALGPILEKLAAEYDGQLLLAKVNADEQQAITANFGVQSLPTVALIKDGQPVDAFQGAEPESVIREKIAPFLPSEWQLKAQAAQQLMEQQDFQKALPLLLEAYTLSEEVFEVAILIAECYVSLKRWSEAEAVLSEASLEQKLHPSYEPIMAKIELMKEAADTPELRELQAKLETDPENTELKYELGVQYSQVERVEEALELLLDVLKADINYLDGGAKKIFLDVISGLPAGDALAARYQRKLFTLLY
ncbi:thioredoxin [Reinekea marina]|uniref:Thioredoxin n=1 Tax=Reinekea marina TaxID=1310421 RepID=A0ABV7WN90_9GAMM|nr:thioredoxin [Reinekea marina]MDN3648666.1 thioredoxin [Reinekea marina]